MWSNFYMYVNVELMTLEKDALGRHGDSNTCLAQELATLSENSGLVIELGTKKYKLPRNKLNSGVSITFSQLVGNWFSQAGKTTSSGFLCRQDFQPLFI